MPAGRRVLVTRPEPGAAATAARLAEAGFTPLVLPLSRVAPVETGVGAGDADAVAATSVNAVRLAAAPLLADLREKPFFAVGGSTAAAARRAGFRDVREGAGDAAALARLVTRSMKGGRIAYLCGRVRRPDFECALHAAGIDAIALETYDTLALEPTPGEIAGLGPAPVDAVLIFSVLGAQAFSRLLTDEALAPLLHDAQAFALSPRIAAALPRPCRVAARPDEAALTGALEEWARG